MLVFDSLGGNNQDVLNPTVQLPPYSLLQKSAVWVRLSERLVTTSIAIHILLRLSFREFYCSHSRLALIAALACYLAGISLICELGVAQLSVASPYLPTVDDFFLPVCAFRTTGFSALNYEAFPSPIWSI